MSSEHTKDDTGFDYMENSGIEEKDRDLCGLLIAVMLMLSLTLFQYAGLF